MEKYDPDLIITTLLIKLTCLQNTLISKGIINQEEFDSEVKKTTENFMRLVLEKSNKSPEEINNIIKEYSKAPSLIKN